jgi:hypothetical protein
MLDGDYIDMNDVVVGSSPTLNKFAVEVAQLEEHEKTSLSILPS